MKTRCDMCGEEYPDESQDWEMEGSGLICDSCQAELRTKGGSVDGKRQKS
jgi:ribosome-binding protein aMBF1 (putative translation factor)